MQKTTQSASPSQPSPFFDLLAEAEEIKIREVPLEAEPDGRTFLVRIKAKPTPAPEPTPTPKSPPENRTYLLRSAELLMVDRDYLLARNIYSYLLKLNLRDESAMKGLGLCFVQLGDTTSAKKCFRALFEISPGPQAHLCLGQCLITEGKDVEALEEFQKITDMTLLSKVDQFELLKEMGNCETRAQRFDSAWAHYHQALKLEPTSDAIHVNLGTLELQRQHPDIALSYFNLALQLNPRSARARCGLGLVCMAKEQLAQARAEFEATLDIESQNLIALFQLIRLSAEDEQLAPVKDRIRKFLQKEPRQAEVRYALAVLLFRDSDWTACEKEVIALLALDPNHAKAKALRDQLATNKHLPV